MALTQEQLLQIAASAIGTCLAAISVFTRSISEPLGQRFDAIWGVKLIQVRLRKAGPIQKHAKQAPIFLCILHLALTDSQGRGRRTAEVAASGSDLNTERGRGDPVNRAERHRQRRGHLRPAGSRWREQSSGAQPVICCVVLLIPCVCTR